MNHIDTLTPEQALKALDRFAQAYRGDAALRERIDAGDCKALIAHGLPVPPDSTVKIVENTDTVFHLVMPPDPNAALTDEELEMVATAGGCLGTASCQFLLSGVGWEWNARTSRIQVNGDGSSDFR